MKISKRENIRLQKRLIACFEELLEDAESSLIDVVADEVGSYTEDGDDDMEIFSTYLEDTIFETYRRRAIRK